MSNRQLYERELDDLRGLVEAARWVLNVASGVGKNGGPPSGQEHTDALDALHLAIEDASGLQVKVFCEDCDMDYEDRRWVDAIVTDGVWAAMGDCDGVLCANCMAVRIRDRMRAPGVWMQPMTRKRGEGS